jgi:hypothetical protein
MKKISIPLIDKVEIIHAVADGSMIYELIKKNIIWDRLQILEQF